jgi:predicted nucleotidyltransferase
VDAGCDELETGLDIMEKTDYYKIVNSNIPYIDKIISIIVSLASPDQIVLFGSYARGDNTENSDIDLLIIKKELKKSFDIIDSIYMAFYENKVKIPVDLLAIDYDRYFDINNEIGYIYKTIKEQGKVLYGTL